MPINERPTSNIQHPTSNKVTPPPSQARAPPLNRAGALANYATVKVQRWRKTQDACFSAPRRPCVALQAMHGTARLQKTKWLS